MEINNIKQKVKTNTFIENNGKILRVLNLLDTKEHKLGNILFIMNDTTKEELKNNLLYLEDSGYIRIHHAAKSSCMELSEDIYKGVKLSVTSRGMKLLMGVEEDPSIEI